MLDSRKARMSIKDLKMERNKIVYNNAQIQETGEKLAGDKEQLDKMKEFVESMDMPKEEKTRTLAYFEQQQKTLESTFEEDVERTKEQQAQMLGSLGKETSDYANSAEQNKGKLDGFRKQSGMDDSAIKKAAQEQGKYAIDYREEQDRILEEKSALEGHVADLKRRVRG